ncbi:hypothetical protein CY652_23680 [Burkholderia sp. WAC0059]|nr:hypothetical protein CY652_23680 [Burkholderia sp. WAC0059]
MESVATCVSLSESGEHAEPTCLLPRSIQPGTERLPYWSTARACQVPPVQTKARPVSIVTATSPASGGGVDEGLGRSA